MITTNGTAGVVLTFDINVRHIGGVITIFDRSILTGAGNFSGSPHPDVSIAISSGIVAGRVVNIEVPLILGHAYQLTVTNGTFESYAGRRWIDSLPFVLPGGAEPQLTDVDPPHNSTVAWSLAQPPSPVNLTLTFDEVMQVSQIAG